MRASPAPLADTTVSTARVVPVKDGAEPPATSDMPSWAASSPARFSIDSRPSPTSQVLPVPRSVRRSDSASRSILVRLVRAGWAKAASAASNSAARLSICGPAPPPNAPSKARSKCPSRSRLTASRAPTIRTDFTRSTPWITPCGSSVRCASGSDNRVWPPGFSRRTSSSTRCGAQSSPIITSMPPTDSAPAGTTPSSARFSRCSTSATAQTGRATGLPTMA